MKACLPLSTCVTTFLSSEHFPCFRIYFTFFVWRTLLYCISSFILIAISQRRGPAETRTGDLPYGRQTAIINELRHTLMTRGLHYTQGVTKRCRLSWLTNSALVYEPICGMKGELRGLRQWAQLYELNNRPNKLWRSNSIFNLWLHPMSYPPHPMSYGTTFFVSR